MFKRICNLLLFTVPMAMLIGVAESQTIAERRREAADIANADKTISSSLAVATSAQGRSLCIEKPVACVGPDKMELALRLDAARNTTASLNALASLVRFALDGGDSEQYDELLLSKGHLIRPILTSLSPDALHRQCKKEFAALVRTNGNILGEVNEQHVCRSAEAIAADIKSTLEAIAKTR